MTTIRRRLEEVEECSQRTLAEVDRLCARLNARPYMAKDAFGALGPQDRAMGFGPDVLAAGAPPMPAAAPSFADLFRGSVELIAERQQGYVEMLRQFQPVLDIGCGRGEMLGLLAEAGIEASGVDADPDCVARCRRLGFDVVLGDAVEVLERRPPQHLGAVFSAQLIEHLDYDALRRLLCLAARRLRPGGMLIVETVNPECHEALKTFHVDPTHQRPLFPQAVLHICRSAGFAAARTFYPLGGGFTQERCLEVGEYAVVARTPAAAPMAAVPGREG